MAKLTAQHTWSTQEELNLWKEARVYASQNRSYSIRGKTYTRQDLKQINEMINQLERELDAQSGRSSVVIGRHARRT